MGMGLGRQCGNGARKAEWEWGLEGTCSVGVGLGRQCGNGASKAVWEWG